MRKSLILNRAAQVQEQDQFLVKTGIENPRNEIEISR